MAYFKHKDKVVKVNSALDVREWEASGAKQCDKDGKALKADKSEPKDENKLFDK